MSEEEIIDIIKTRLSLDVRVDGNGDGHVSVSVKLMLDGEEIAYNSDGDTVTSS